MIDARTLLAAFTVDLLAGDPRWLPHPVRLIGGAITTGERTLRRYAVTPRGELAGGALLRTCREECPN